MKVLDTIINSDEEILGLYAEIKMDLHMLAAQDIFEHEDLIDSFDLFMNLIGKKLDRVFEGKTVITNAIAEVQRLYKETGVGPLVEVTIAEHNGFGYTSKGLAEFDPFKVEMILDSGIRFVEGESIHTSTLVFHSGRELITTLTPHHLGRLVDKYRTLHGKTDD